MSAKRNGAFIWRGLGLMACVLLSSACSSVDYVQSVLHPGGDDAAIIADIAWWLFIGGTMIFIGVMVLLVLSLRDNQRKVAPVVWLLGAGVVFPVTVLSALLVFSISRSQHLLEPVSHDALVVSVTARMWWWEVRYRDEETGRDITLANEIRIPAGKPVYFALSSGDVIHSFWVPALAGKVDMLPGRLTRLRVNAATPGVYRGQCAEFCGEQHARMALHVIVQTQEEYDAWMANQRQPAAVPTNTLSERGRAIFLEQRCSACHTVRGVAEENLIGGFNLGPDLTHVGSRMYLGAGILPNEGDSMRQWISQTQRFKHGARMPEFSHLGDDSLHALSTYLEQLK